MIESDGRLVRVAATSKASEVTAAEIINALLELQVDARWGSADGGEDETGAGVVMVVDQMPQSLALSSAALIVLSAGDAPAGSGVISLSGGTPGQTAARWAALADWVGARIDRPGLGDYLGLDGQDAKLDWAAAHGDDPLAVDLLRNTDPDRRLAAAESAVEALKDALAATQVELDAATHQLSTQTDAHRAAIADLHAKLGETAAALTQAEADAARADLADQSLALLQPDIEDANRPITALPDTVAEAVAAARLASRLAQSAADTAEKIAIKARLDDPPAPGLSALDWPEAGASYAGETLNGAPHGLGVLKFANGETYTGGFFEGRRKGYGVGAGDQGIWRGEWRADQPAGSGVFLTQGDEVFEGAAAGDGPHRDGPGALWSKSGDLIHAGAWRMGEAPVASPRTSLPAHDFDAAN